jgi:hypothetical protein
MAQALLAACAINAKAPFVPAAPAPVPAFGAAYRHNMAVQIVAPEPAEVAGLPPGDGDRALLMIGRYKADKVRPPEETAITPVGASGGAAPAAP